MNPEDNKLNPSSGTPGSGPSNEPIGMNGLTMSDGLASAEDNLTSAGLAASTDEGMMDLNQLGATAPEAIMTPPVEEPLIPAAPVPGSIGSVTSVPPVSPEQPTVADVANPNPAGMSAAEPAPAPYNPFAQNAAPATEPAAPAPGMAPNPAFQPNLPTKPKAKVPPAMIVLGALAGILLITTITFAVLYFIAKDNTKIIYVPQTSNDESNARIEMLTCSRETADEFAAGIQTLTASYTNNDLRALTLENRMQFASEEDANAAQTMYAIGQAELIESISGSFSVKYNVEGGDLDIIITSNSTLDDNDAAGLLYGLDGIDGSVAMDDVSSYYEEAGFACSVE